MSSSMFSCRFQIAKLFFKNGQPLVLKALNFEDKISIRRGECNTPITANLFIRQNLSRRSNQQRFPMKEFNETRNP
jgi:hypothetical protein